MTFLKKLKESIRSRNTLLCIGLDPEIERLPEGFRRSAEGVVAFNRAIVEATADCVCAYKPNMAFYEALGPAGLEALARTLEAIPPDVPVIGDAKRGDIGNTARLYAQSLFEGFGFDAVTLNPYLGRDGLDPFLAYADRGVFVLCRTSNPGAAEFQELLVSVEGRPRELLYEAVARQVQSWPSAGTRGLVVGATAPAELARIRALAPDLPLLIPGVGSQGGDLLAAVAAHRPDAPAVINVGRAILFASGQRDFAEAARRAAQTFAKAMAPQ